MSKIKDEYSCALLLGMDLVGGKWKLRILWHINNGDDRFSLLRKGIPDISEKMLTTQLRELVETELIERTVLAEKPLMVQYNISKKYNQLDKIVQLLCDFAKEYGEINHIRLNE